MEKYYLITVRNHDGFTDSFIGKGKSTYDAFISKVENSKGKNGFIYSNWHSIIFSQEATKDDYELFIKQQCDGKN